MHLTATKKNLQQTYGTPTSGCVQNNLFREWPPQQIRADRTSGSTWQPVWIKSATKELNKSPASDSFSYGANTYEAAADAQHDLKTTDQHRPLKPDEARSKFYFC